MSNECCSEASTRLAALFRMLSQPVRIEILLAIGSGEACVCHLEAVLGQRQAFISQHLMALRDADILTTRREGRFIYYRLQDAGLMEFIRAAAGAAGVPTKAVVFAIHDRPQPGCSCPHCLPDNAGQLLIPTQDIARGEVAPQASL